MKSNVREEDIIFRYPSKEEIKAAQLACCGRCCDACETPAEYAWRKRSVDLSVLLENAIEKAFSIPAGTLKYLVPYFDKIAVSDLIKLTKNEIQNLPYFGDMGLFDILKAQTKKISNFFGRSR